MQSISLSASVRADAEPRDATNLSSGNAFEMQSVSRLFGALKAIDSVSFDVARGAAPRGARQQRRRQDGAFQRNHGRYFAHQRKGALLRRRRHRFNCAPDRAAELKHTIEGVFQTGFDALKRDR